MVARNRSGATISPIQLWREREAQLPKETVAEVREAFRWFRPAQTAVVVDGCYRCGGRMTEAVKVRVGALVIKVHDECVGPDDDVIGYDGGAA